MIMTTDMKQRAAAMPNAALIGPIMLDPKRSNGWADGIADSWECGMSRTHGFTATRSTRSLGSFST